MPHVVMIVIDALRADHVGRYAGRDLGTPALDALAAEGAVFANAVSQASWTRPSVTSLLTGLYPSQHNLTDRAKSGARRQSVTALDPGLPTLAERLAAEGYATAAFAGGNANLRPVFGITRGFSHFDWHQTTDGAVLVSAFEEWLAGSRSERSFAYLHLMDVHHPLPAEIIPGRLDGGVDAGLLEQTTRGLLEAYAAAVRRADGHVARVLSALARAGRLDDALVVVTADHGEELGERGALLAHGRTLYPELIHVPLLLRFPGRVHAGRVASEPVQLVDLVPTLLDHLELPRAELPGRSLLALLRGEAEGRWSPAYSELMRRDRYAQAVRTATHQLIKTYVLEEAPDLAAAELEPGLVVSIKGQPIQGGPFLATKVGLKADSEERKVRALVERVDPGTRSLEAMGMRFELAPGAELAGFDGGPLRLADLAPGEKASIRFRDDAGRLLVDRVARRKLGGKSKIVGRIEAVRDAGENVRLLTVLGVEIAVRRDLPVGALRQKRSGKLDWREQLELVAAGEVAGVRTELYDLQADPRATRDVAAEQPHVAQELESLLAGWTAAIAGGAPVSVGTVDLDADTLEQLRRMGYVD